MRILLIIISFCCVLSVNSQSKREIANAYIKRANDAIESSIDYTTALINFNKALKYIDVITDARIASLGAKAYYEIHHKQRTLDKQIKFLKKSNYYSKKFFSLAKNKNSDAYLDNLDTYALARKDLKDLMYKKRKKSMRKF